MRNIRKYRKAFSLTEVLIALALMGLLGAGVVSLMSTGSVLAGRDVNLSSKLTAERFSLENIYRELQHGLDSVRIITNAEARNTPIPNDDRTVVIFLDDNGHILKRSRFGEMPLFATDRIEGLRFMLPTVSSDVAADYILSVNVAAGNVVNDRSAPRSAERNIALLGRPVKDGDPNLLSNAVWSGDAISYVPQFDGFEVYDLHVHENDLGNQRLDHLSVAKGTEFIARYTITLPRGATGDESIIRWFISNVPENLATYRELGDVPENPISGNRNQVFNTGNRNLDFVLSNGALFGREGFVRYQITPRTTVNGVTIQNDSMWSPWVDVQDPAIAPSGGRFYGRFRAAIAAGLGRPGNNAASAYQMGFRMDFKDLATLDGDESIAFTEQGNSKVGEAIGGFYGDLLPEDLEEAMDYEEAFRKKYEHNSIVPFTNVANYSIIVDARLLNRTNSVYYGCFLNGDVQNMYASSGNANKGAEYSGYSVETNRNYGIAMRAFSANLSDKKIAANDVTGALNPIGAVRVPLTGRETSEIELNHGYTYQYTYNSTQRTSPPYYPKHMQILDRRYGLRTLPLYSFPGYVASGNTEWDKRFRIMYTVLEYKAAGVISPRFIVRVKFLRTLDLDDTANTYNANDRRNLRLNGDHFYMGKDFYLSEPIWFGDFVGAGIGDEELQIRNYKHPVSNDIYSNDIMIKSNDFSVANDPQKLYAMWTEGDVNVTPNNFHLLTRGKEMNVRGFPGLPAVVDQVFSRANRTRILGMNLDTSSVAIRLHNITLAPGFTPEELLAIMPENAQLLSPKDIYIGMTGVTIPARDIRRYNDIGDLNTALFGSGGSSDGKGNESRLNALTGLQDRRPKVGVKDIQFQYYRPYYMLDNLRDFKDVLDPLLF